MNCEFEIDFKDVQRLKIGLNELVVLMVSRNHVLGGRNGLAEAFKMCSRLNVCLKSSNLNVHLTH